MRLDPCSRHRVGEVDAVPVGQGARTFGGHDPGGEARPQAGDAETGALLFDEEPDAERCRGGDPLLAKGVDHGERRDHPERSVEGAATLDRVQVRPDQQPLAGYAVRPPPGDRVALPVALHVQVSCRCLAVVPGRTLALGRAERRPVIAAG